jgi:hypothetical protein
MSEQRCTYRGVLFCDLSAHDQEMVNQGIIEPDPPAAPVEPPAPDAVEALRELTRLWDVSDLQNEAALEALLTAGSMVDAAPPAAPEGSEK